MIQNLQLEAHALGALFYYGPSHDASKALFEAIAEASILELLPDLPLEKWQEALLKPDLSTAWQASFYGPGYLAAPPWGSVYLDPEAVVFGESLLELRDFLNNLNLHLTSDMNEPEDHFGLLLLLLAQLIAQQPESTSLPKAAEELLTQHLLPWSDHYLSCLATSAEHPFIQQLAKYTKLRLAAWSKDFNLEVAAKNIHWPPS